jgi:polysaccharide pyruvyl transferase CsaB
VTEGTTGQPRRRVFLVGYYGVGNLGDELIRRAIERRAEAIGVEILAYANWGKANDADPRAVRFRGRGFFRYLRACLAADRVVLGGGGILKDEGRRMPLELLATVALARTFRKPVAMAAVGVGPFYTSLGRAAIKAVARLCGYRSVRDRDSAEALTGLGVGRVEVAADPVFSLAEAVSGRDESRPVDPLATGGRVLVSVRPWFLRDSGGRWSRFTEAVAAALDGLLERGLEADFTAFYWPRDREAAAAVTRHLRHSATLPAGPATLDELSASLRAARLVVAMRYHAVLLAVAAGRPTVAIAYEPKVAALAERLGIGCVSADDPELAAHLADRIDETLRGVVVPAAAIRLLSESAAACVDRALGGGAPGEAA